MAEKRGIDTVYLQDGSKLTFDLKTVTIPPPASTDQMNIETWNVNAIKSGKVVTVQMSIQGRITGSTTWINMGSIPKEFSPVIDFIKSYIITDDNIHVEFWINTNGVLYLHNFSRDIRGNLLTDTITYICA